MAAPGNDVLVGLFGIFTAIAAAYACGRMHQWYRQTDERENAFQRGYDRASHSLFSLTARAAGNRPGGG